MQTTFNARIEAYVIIFDGAFQFAASFTYIKLFTAYYNFVTEKNKNIFILLIFQMRTSRLRKISGLIQGHIHNLYLVDY